jgi:hypothetical protein
MTRCKLLKDCAIVTAVALMIAACQREAAQRPSGFIRLEYVEASGSTAVFRLTNHSTQPIYFRGSERSGLAVPLAGVATMQCRAVDSDAWSWGDFKIAEAGPEAIEVGPDKEQLVSVDGAFAQQHKGGRCLMRLSLEGGAFIESRSFEPSAESRSGRARGIGGALRYLLFWCSTVSIMSMMNRCFARGRR